MRKCTLLLSALLLALASLTSYAQPFAPVDSAALKAGDWHKFIDSEFHDIHYRGDLSNSMKAIVVDRKATVAFLGGSITEMNGWRNMVEEDLRQQFPQTEFTFIDAGISSLGSTPHSFRFKQDVLAHGTPDLLFLEAAVNDHTNDFGPREQVRGMEGVVRHALKANPNMDIVMLDFIYEPFIPLLAAGEQPDVILNHERVANHYHLTSINLAQEISDRMQAGILTWKEFGGTHPAWYGHEFYAAAIDAVLKANTGLFKDYAVKAHDIPAPLEANCYEGGKLVPVTEATKLKGFQVVEDWTPAIEANTRNGFVNVTMLSADKGGSFEFRFKGKAVGIFCVCGPDSGEIEYSIDGAAPRKLNTRTKWSRTLYLPWVYVLDADLENTEHVLKVSVDKSLGCHIRNFVVNE